MQRFKPLILPVFRIALLAALPWMYACEKAVGIKDPETGASAVFEELWEVIDRRYALFAVKDVAWEQVRDDYRQEIAAASSGEEAFTLMSDMLATLRDGHVALISDSDTSVYERFYTGFPANFNYDNVLNRYLLNDYRRFGPVIFKAVDGIGYLHYPSFGADITDQELEALFAEVAGTRGLIIDVRGNTGGRSSNTDKLFAQFITARTLVKYEVAKNGPGHDAFFPPKPYYVEPSGRSYLQPVAVLTNRSCFSACNDFVSYMSGLPNVTLVGDQTGGGGAVPHNYVLANGWKLQYSATVTLDASGASLENGVQPDLPAGISSADEANGRDPILERAYQALQ